MDRAGKPRLATRTADNGDTEILRVTDAGFEEVYRCGVFETCNPLQFHTDNARVYMETNRGEPDLTRLVLFNPDTKQEELVESDPQNEVDFGGAIFSEKTDELVGHGLRRRPHADLFPRQVVRSRLRAGEEQAARTSRSRSPAAPTTIASG